MLPTPQALALQTELQHELLSASIPSHAWNRLTDKTHYNDLDLIISDQHLSAAHHWVNARHGTLEGTTLRFQYGPLPAELLIVPETHLEHRLNYHRHSEGGMLLSAALTSGGFGLNYQGLFARERLGQQHTHLLLEGGETLALELLGIDPVAYRQQHSSQSLTELLRSAPYFSLQRVKNNPSYNQRRDLQRPTYAAIVQSVTRPELPASTLTERLQQLAPDQALRIQEWKVSLRATEMTEQAFRDLWENAQRLHPHLGPLQLRFLKALLRQGDIQANDLPNYVPADTETALQERAKALRTRGQAEYNSRH